jgi:GTP-binding protein EngB required for normal cell division
MRATVTTEPGSAHLDTLVADFVDRAVELAAEKQREDLVGRLRDEARRDDGASVTVVVAGEAKRGKSSLVNALLASDLSPVDAAPATTAHIVLEQAPSTRVRVFRDEIPFGQDVAPEELSSWVTAMGNPQNAKHVRSVEIGFNHPLLAQGIVLVDTPGVGGLEAAHADVTLAALSTADVLLFVLDASAPISDRELTFLGRVTERISNVLIVLTKIDTYPGADEVAGENRRLLAGTRFAQAPVFAVSSTRKRRADELRGAANDLAERLRAMSGFVEFERELLAHTVGRAKTLRLANTVQLGRIVLDRLDESEQAVIEGARGNSRHRDELETARRRAQELDDARRIGNSVVADEFVTLQDVLATDFERALLELEHRHRLSFRRRGMKLETLPERLDAELNALVARLNASMAEGVSEIVVALAAKLALEGFGTIDVEPARAGELTMVRVPLLASRADVDTVLDTTRAMGVMHVPERLLSGLTAVAFGGAVGAVVGVVAGLAIVGVTLVKSGRVRNQQQAQELVAEAVRAAQREIPPVLRARIREVRREVEESVYQAVRRRESELATAIREHELMAKKDARTQSRAVAAAANRRATLKRLREQAENLLTELAAARPATAT